jgi:DNA invertase Pin-like site-specific DNA recombinase
MHMEGIALHILKQEEIEQVFLLTRVMYLGRSLTELEKRGIGFKSLQEQIDTTSSSGKLVFHIWN